MQDNPALSKEASPSHLQAIFVQFNKFPNWYARWVLNCAPQFNSLGRDHLYSPPRFPSFFASLTFPPATRARRRRRGGSYLSLFLPPLPSFTRFNFLSIEGASLSPHSIYRLDQVKALSILIDFALSQIEPPPLCFMTRHALRSALP